MNNLVNCYFKGEIRLKNTLFKKEFSAIIRNKKVLIPIIAVLFIPVLYSGMFLWAFWDPYDHLSDLPVAVVNEDQGAVFDGKELHLGDELTAKLEESHDFQFTLVKKQQGYEELNNQQYYMLIEIPKDFSKNATTLLDKEPKKVQLKYVPNEGYNFLSAQIGGTAVEKIKASLSEKIIETYSETMFDKVEELANGIGQASDGASKIKEGAEKLNQGSAVLHEKLSLLADKSIEFNQGIGQANSGSKKLADGSSSLAVGLSQLQEGHSKLEDASKQLQAGHHQLALGISKSKEGLAAVNEKLPNLVTGTKQVESGANSLSISLSQWQTEVEKVNGGVNVLQQRLQVLLTQLPENSPERLEIEGALKQLQTGTSELAGAAGKIAEGSTELAANLGLLKNGQEQLQQGLNELAKGSNNLEYGANQVLNGEKEFQAGMDIFSQKLADAKTGAEELASGANGLAGGIEQLEKGSSAIQRGADQLKDGAGKLAEGNATLLSGSAELAEKLEDGSEKAASVHPTNKTYEMMAGPVKIENDQLNKVPNYGTGFAPYFLSLGLFVGALLLSIVFPLREPAGTPKNGRSWFGSKFLILMGIGIIQALMAVFILLVGLKMEVQSIPLFILFAIITSITFIALIQFLVTLFADPGRFIAIIILILQLTTSAGTFPLELIPHALQPINAFLPMTYSVSGFKAVISSGDFNYMWHQAGILALYGLSFMTGTILYFTGMFKKRFRAVTE